MSGLWKKILLIAGIFLLGAFSAWIFLKKDKEAVFKQEPKQECSKNYPFVSEEIDCATIDDVADQVNELHGNIAKIIREEKDKENINRASVFYRDLHSRRWFGINDLEKYYPASLLKLPMAITYYKIAELQPDIFDQEMKIATEGEIADNSDQHYPPENPLVPGETYSVREMIRHMLLYSDNAPFSTLADLAKAFGSRTFVDLGVYASYSSAGEEEWNFSPRIFANIFRMLYNASYVKIESSNEILSMLSEASFKKGIVEGIPEGVRVAHKFGEAQASDGEKKLQLKVLNDCGIVYKPENPFILCIMTEGEDFSKLEKVIQEISKEAYNAL